MIFSVQHTIPLTKVSIDCANYSNKLLESFFFIFKYKKLPRKWANSFLVWTQFAKKKLHNVAQIQKSTKLKKTKNRSMWVIKSLLNTPTESITVRYSTNPKDRHRRFNSFCSFTFLCEVDFKFVETFEISNLSRFWIFLRSFETWNGFSTLMSREILKRPRKSRKSRCWQ